MTRKIIAFLKDRLINLPLSKNETTHILIAVSGGADSMALLHWVYTYGQRVVSRERIKVVHFNHGWRGEASDQDAQFVEDWCLKRDILFSAVDLKSVETKSRDSKENVFRQARKKWFLNEIENERASHVLTAHHGDDLAQTVLWRFLTGSLETHGNGIRVSDSGILRPFLPFRKSDLLSYLKEEGISYREDSTNEDLDFLRNRLRKRVLPVLEESFPNCVERLIEYGLNAGSEDHGILRELFFSAGVEARKGNYDEVRRQLSTESGEVNVHLSNDWRLRRDKRRSDGTWKITSTEGDVELMERWILDKSR